jgi:hypothetical protein
LTVLRARLLEGLLIPAHPLALTQNRTLAEKHQRALTRYYAAAGAGGVAVGVHTTQFAIHDAKSGLLQPVLALAAEEIGTQPIVKIAGVCGLTRQAVLEAEMAADLRYHAVLLSLSAFRNGTIQQMIDHAKAVVAVLPIFGFYLQPSVGGRVLPYDFWLRLLEIENVVAIKVAPFNRYQTLDVARALADSGRAGEVALYSGNDDNIVVDLLTIFEIGGERIRFSGGLLGHWAVWTKSAREYFDRTRKITQDRLCIEPDLLTLAAQVTDANGALFDVANNFRGCIAGLHEILRRQGLMQGRWCLDPSEDLSLGQQEEIERVCARYPFLQDDSFVQEHLDGWLR